MKYQVKDRIYKAASEILGEEGENWYWLPVENQPHTFKVEIREDRLYAFALFDLRESFQGDDIKDRLRHLIAIWNEGPLI